MGWEYRLFVAVGDGPMPPTAPFFTVCGGSETRTDVYLPVSAACGAKHRGVLLEPAADGVQDLPQPMGRMIFSNVFSLP